jgi:hypothetical protein
MPRRQCQGRQRLGGRLRAAIQPAIASTTMISASAMPRAARVSQSICRPAHVPAPKKVLNLGYPQPKDGVAAGSAKACSAEVLPRNQHPKFARDRACPGHPRLEALQTEASKTWVPGTRPGTGAVAVRERLSATVSHASCPRWRVPPPLFLRRDDLRDGPARCRFRQVRMVQKIGLHRGIERVARRRRPA